MCNHLRALPRATEYGSVAARGGRQGQRDFLSMPFAPSIVSRKGIESLSCSAVRGPELPAYSEFSYVSGGQLNGAARHSKSRSSSASLQNIAVAVREYVRRSWDRRAGDSALWV